MNWLRQFSSRLPRLADGDADRVTYIGADGAGHYVKMVRNGIEYGDMAADR